MNVYVCVFVFVCVAGLARTMAFVALTAFRIMSHPPGEKREYVGSLGGVAGSGSTTHAKQRASCAPMMSGA